MSESPRDLVARERAARERFDRAGQGHVFRFLDHLSPDEREALISQTEGVDLELTGRLADLAARRAGTAGGVLEPVDVVRPAERDAAEMARAREAGEALLVDGRVACVLVAGGQATRLGYPGPKGTFPIGPVTDRTLFEWFAGRILALGDRHGRCPPLYVMTSEATHDATQRYFAERDHLGLAPTDVRMFRQGMVPALDDEGRLILETPSRIFLGPNGHGGVFEALDGGGLLAEMAERGVEEIFCFQVDNVLARVADPLFLGLHHEAGAQMSTKVVEKSSPGEKVGVVGRRDGRLGVVEYSEMSAEEMEARGPDGRLVHGAGNIAIHAIRREFAERIARRGTLPYHSARKAVPHVDETGKIVRPESPNATKFERFVFDALPETDVSITLEVDRAAEFAPVKNAEGDDSPATASAAMTNLFRRWYDAAGIAFPRVEDSGGYLAIEIDPRIAIDERSLRERVAERRP